MLPHRGFILSTKQQAPPPPLVFALELDVDVAAPVGTPHRRLEDSEEATTPEGVVVGIDSIVGALGDEAEVAEVGIAGEIGGYVLVGLLGRVSCYPSLTNCQVRSRSRY